MRKIHLNLLAAFVFAVFTLLAFGSAEPPRYCDDSSTSLPPSNSAPPTNSAPQTNNTGSQNLGWVSGENNSIGWATIPMHDKVGFAMAWDDITSLLARRFEFEMLQKETGYIRTKWKNWKYSNYETTENYRVRVTVKISDLRKKVEVNTEAEKLINGVWHKGTDTRLLEDLKKDIGGLVGF
jgi:uncharacterized lipoprotein